MGRDRGAAQAMEQSLLADPETVRARTAAFVRYSTLQDIAGAIGSLGAAIPGLLVAYGVGGLLSWRLTFALAGLLTVATSGMYLGLARGGSRIASASSAAGVSPESKRRIAGLAGLFSLDSLGGGFLASSILSYWFFRRFGFTGAELGPLFLAGRMLNVGSYAAAGRLAGRIGLLRTMVYTHLPSSVVLLFLPFVGTPWQAIVIFLLRESLVQMDVPTRQSYVALVTRPGERTLAMGVTNLTRNVGWALGPSAAGVAMATFGLGAPLVIGAGLKIAYDLLLFAAYRKVPER
jgi:predicted MFS family arabinose efflux permease